MLIDNLVSFVPVGSNLSLVAGAGINVASGIVDILGLGVGQNPANSLIIGNRTIFGSDVGIGGKRPQIQVNIGTAFTTANGNTLNVAYQAAPDQGSAGSFQPGTWQTLEETGPLTAAQLTAAQIVARFDFVPNFPANLNARYLRLLFQVLPAGSFTAGTISSAIVTLTRDDEANKFAARNYVVA